MTTPPEHTECGQSEPTQVIVCAACRYGLLILCGARHWDRVMSDQYLLAKQTGAYPGTGQFEQGFIDQFGTFINREDALKIARNSGQLEGRKKHPPEHLLFSEDLY